MALSELIQRLTVDHLHIVGDIYDRGPGPHIIMDKLMGYILWISNGEIMTYSGWGRQQDNRAVLQCCPHLCKICKSGDFGGWLWN